jgi:3-hydroxybutyryl-CoA dehydrogenase
MTVESIGVIGCGLMGSGIAEVFARTGATVLVHEVSKDAAALGRSRIERSLERGLVAGKLTAEEAAGALDRITFDTDLGALGPVGVCVEAATEDDDLKVELFRRLDKVVESPTAILATNTSSVPIMKLGTVTTRPTHVVGIHFFNPVPVLPLVEIVPSLLTSPETVRRAQVIAEGLGKTVIRSQDRAGFIVNALLVPYLLSAVRMVESGFASCEDIDAGMVEGCAHPMGPLRLTDLIGVDTVAAIANSLYDEFKEPLYSPPPLLSRMVDAGLLGRKSGRGFYEYSR